eukprot:619735-Amphidinium_carterae.1
MGFGTDGSVNLRDQQFTTLCTPQWKSSLFIVVFEDEARPDDFPFSSHDSLHPSGPTREWQNYESDA